MPLWTVRFVLIIGATAILGTAACRGSAEVTSVKSTTRPRLPTLLGRSSHTTKLDVRPRWERVGEFQGHDEETTGPISIDGAALQWRARWRCSAGDRLVIAVSPSPDGAALIDRGCPGRGEAYAVETGPLRLSVRAQGSWQAVIEQQVDTPLQEATLERMGSPTAQLIAEGTLGPIEQEGKGKVTLYELPGGRLALRLENFWVTPNVDLELWASSLARPKTSRQVFRAAHERVRFLKATAGDHNYVLPRDLEPERMRSIAIWCQLTHEVYAAAALTR